MKLEDIANLLAEKINQSHYVLHYLKKVFAKGFELGNLDKENFAIGFLDSIKDYERENGRRICFDERTTKQLLEIYKKTL